VVRRTEECSVEQYGAQQNHQAGNDETRDLIRRMT
jgi:hypothetical protein